MYKRPILVLMVLGALLVLVGTGFTFAPQTQTNSNATPTNQAIGSDNCCDEAPVNCETGEPCTEEEIEECLTNGGCSAKATNCTPRTDCSQSAKRNCSM